MSAPASVVVALSPLSCELQVNNAVDHTGWEGFQAARDNDAQGVGAFAVHLSAQLPHVALIILNSFDASQDQTS